MNKKLVLIAMVALGLNGLQAEDNDIVEAQKFDAFVYQVYALAPQFQYKIEDCGDEALLEYLWLYHFLEGHSPSAAIRDLQENDRCLR